MMRNQESRGMYRLSWLVVILLVVGWALVLSVLSSRQHDSFHNIGNDLGIYTQIVWTTSAGDPFYTSLTRQTTNFLGHHFVPLVALFAPLYQFFPDARLLLIGQALCLALGAIPLFRFALQRLPLVAAIGIVVVYFLSPLLAHIALFEFHEISLAVPFLMAAGAALLNHCYRRMAIWLLIALGAKEEVALIAIGFGLYLLMVVREWRWGLGVTAGSILWSLFLFGWFMPHLNTLEGSYTFLQRYPSLGSTTAEIFGTLFTHPQKVFALITTPAKLKFLGALLLPLGVLPLAGLPALLLAVPTLAYLLLSDYELQVAITHHYSAPLIPFFFLATVVALQRAYRARRWVGHGALIWVCITAIGGYWLLGPLPGGAAYVPTRYDVTEADRETQALLATIPSTATVASDWKYFPFLANRRHIDDLLNPSIRPINQVIPDYLVTTAPASDATSAPLYPFIAPELNELSTGELVMPTYELIETTTDGTQVWQRDDDTIGLQWLDVPFENGMILVGVGGDWRDNTIKAGDTVPIWMAWGAQERQPRRLTFTIQVFRGEERVAQTDREMGAGRFPTPRWHDWLTQPVVVDAFPLTVPSDMSPGSYTVRVGVYESDSVRALTTLDGEVLIPIGTIHVTP